MVGLQLAFFGLVLISLSPHSALAPNTGWVTHAPERALDEASLVPLPESLTIYEADGHDGYDAGQQVSAYGTGYIEPPYGKAYDLGSSGPSSWHSSEQYSHPAPVEHLRYGIEANNLAGYQQTVVPDRSWAGRQGPVPSGTLLGSTDRSGGSHSAMQAGAYPHARQDNTLQPVAGRYHPFPPLQPNQQTPWNEARHPAPNGFVQLMDSPPETLDLGWTGKTAGPSRSHTGVQPRPAASKRTHSRPKTTKAPTQPARKAASPPAFVAKLDPWDKMLRLTQDSLRAHKEELVARGERLLSEPAYWTELDSKKTGRRWIQMVPSADLEAWVFDVLRFKRLQSVRAWLDGHLEPLLAWASAANLDITVAPLPANVRATVDRLLIMLNQGITPDGVRVFLDSAPDPSGQPSARFAIGTIHFYVWPKRVSEEDKKVLGNGRAFSVAAVDSAAGEPSASINRYCIFNPVVVNNIGAEPLFVEPVSGWQ